jgi:hypothetical protein
MVAEALEIHFMVYVLDIELTPFLISKIILVWDSANKRSSRFY